MRGASSAGHGAGAGAGAGTVARRDPLAGYRPRVVAGMWTLFMLVLKRSLVQVRGSCCHVCGTVCQCAFVHQVTVYTACVCACACARIQSARRCHRLLQHSRTKMSFLIGESSISSMAMPTQATVDSFATYPHRRSLFSAPDPCSMQTTRSFSSPVCSWRWCTSTTPCSARPSPPRCSPGVLRTWAPTASCACPSSRTRSSTGHP